MNVYPEDLEAALRRQPEVKDVVVIALPVNGNAEPCAAIILRDGGADPEPIVKRANESLAEYQRMQRGSYGQRKTFPAPRRRSRLETSFSRRYKRSRRRRSSDQTPSSPLAELIGRITGRAPSRLSSDANLESDLNLSSLDRVALMSALEDRYQIDLSETRFAAVNTVGELERMLQGKLPPRMPYHYPRWVAALAGHLGPPGCALRVVASRRISSGMASRRGPRESARSAGPGARDLQSYRRRRSRISC